MIFLDRSALDHVNRRALKSSGKACEVKALHVDESGAPIFGVALTGFELEGTGRRLAGLMSAREGVVLSDDGPGLPEAFTSRCDLCKRKARRQRVWLLRDEKGTVTQAGTECVKDVLLKNARTGRAVVACGALTTAFKQAMGRYSGTLATHAPVSFEREAQALAASVLANKAVAAYPGRGPDDVVEHTTQRKLVKEAEYARVRAVDTLAHVKFARVIAVHRIVPPVYEEIRERRVTSTGYRAEWQSFRAAVLRGEQPAPPEGWRPFWARLVAKIKRALASSEAQAAFACLVYDSGLVRLDGPLIAPPECPNEEAQGLFACAIADRPSHGPVEAVRKLIWA